MLLATSDIQQVHQLCFLCLKRRRKWFSFRHENFPSCSATKTKTGIWAFKVLSKKRDKHSLGWGQSKTMEVYRLPTSYAFIQLLPLFTLNNVGLIRPKDILNLRSVLCAYVQDLLPAVIDKLLRTSNMPNLLINCGQKSIESVFVCCLRLTKETTTVNDEQQKREESKFFRERMNFPNEFSRKKMLFSWTSFR